MATKNSFPRMMHVARHRTLIAFIGVAAVCGLWVFIYHRPLRFVLLPAGFALAIYASAKLREWRDKAVRVIPGERERK